MIPGVGGGERLVGLVLGWLLLGRHGTGRQQCGEGYNGESVFQGKSHVIEIVRFYAMHPLRVRRCNTNLHSFHVVHYSCLSYQKSK